MQPLRRVAPEELTSLLMENELLRYEVRHLRAQLAESRAATEKAINATDRAEEPQQETVTQAQQDLVWLLRRIDEIPVAGGLIRRRPGIRHLRERHLGAQD